MIPRVEIDLQNDFEITDQETSKTYRLDNVKNRMLNFTDGLEAVRQAIYLILNTERYQYVIYSWNYGVELDDLIGEPITFVLSEIKRRITEALMQDDRISGVDAFSFETTKNKAYVAFTVHTIYGDAEAEREVSI